MIVRIALTALLCLATAAAVAQAPDIERMDLVERATPDGPVARVRGTSISRGAFLYLYKTQLAELAQLQQTANPSDDLRVRTALATLAELVRREVMWQEGVKRGIKAPEGEVQERYQAQMDRLREFLERSSGEAVTEAQILERAGQPKEQALEQIRKSLVVRGAAEAIAKEQGVTVSDATVATYFEEHPEYFERSGGTHLKHIFIEPKPSAEEATEEAWDAAQRSIEKAQARMRAGERFETVARDVSDSPRAAEGGDLGMQPTAMLPKAYAEAAAAMKPGDTSGILRDKHGFHIIRLVAVEDAQSVPFSEAKDAIRRRLEADARERAVAAFVEPIVADPKEVRIFLQLERTLAGMMPPEGADS